MKSLVMDEMEQRVGQWSDAEIEQLYKRYNYNQELLVLLEEPGVVSQLRLAPSAHNCSSVAEHIAVNKAQAGIEVKMVESCLRIMIEVEKDFIELRYFRELNVKKICGCMGYSKRKIFQIRDQVIEKSKMLLTITGCVNGSKTKSYS